jgi:hypothetical protein
MTGEIGGEFGSPESIQAPPTQSCNSELRMSEGRFEMECVPQTVRRRSLSAHWDRGRKYISRGMGRVS